MPPALSTASQARASASHSGKRKRFGESLARGDLAHYEAAHRRIMRNASRMTRLLLLIGASATIRRKALRLFAAHPNVFSRLMSIHAGDRALAADSLAAILEILDPESWRVLWA